MTFENVHIPVPVLKLKGYSLSKKILLGLVSSFNSKGLRMSNNVLSEILDVKPSYVSDLLTELEAGGDIEIKNRQSKYRTIYLRPQSKVKSVLLSEKIESKDVLLSTKTGFTFDKSRNITKRTKEDTTTAKHKGPLCDIPPTVTQVKEYATTQGKPDFDAEHFVGWYSANDWKHKDGKPVLNWKQTVLTWLRRDKKIQDEKPEPKRGDPNWLPTEEEAEAILNEVRT